MPYDYAVMVALADPTRRAVFELVVERPRSVADLKRSLPVSQSAVSQHLKVLKDARLVQSETQGTRNIYRVDPIGLRGMRRWLDGLWTDALVSFAHEIGLNEENSESAER